MTRRRWHGVIGGVATATYAASATLVSTLVPGRHASVAVGLALITLGVRPVQRAAEALAGRLLPLPSVGLSHFAAATRRLPADEAGLSDFARLLSELPGAAAARVVLRVSTGSRVERAHPLDSWPAGRTPETVCVDLPGKGKIEVVAHPGLGQRRQLAEIVNVAVVQAAAYLETVLLTIERRRQIVELDRRAAELDEMRRRIVAVSDAERSQLERNLHDGAQQQLTALVIQLGAASEMAVRSPERLPYLLAELTVWAEDALSAIVELGEGGDPRLLRDEGLARALLVRASRLPVAVDVDIADVGRHRSDIEATVYFTCLEAIHNALRHAGPSRISVGLHLEDDELVFIVSDDGRGYDPDIAVSGAGINNFRDRLASAGGACEIVSEPGHGTSVRGRVSLAVPDREPV